MVGEPLSDLGHTQTDRILRQTEGEIRKAYARANKEIQAKVDSYMAQFKDGAEQLRQEVAAGKATQEDYERYMTRKALTGKRWTDMRDVLAADYHNANKIAMSTVMGHMQEVYALNHDFATFQLEHDAKIDTSYTLYNHDAAERLMRSPQQLLPKPKAGTPSARAAANKDLRWNARHIQAELLQGILQGEDYHGIARRLQRVTDMNLKAAVRNARTMTTSAQNAGRMAAAERVARKGVEMQKEWVATLDHVTRDSHADLHGERVDLDKPFSNGLDFPGGAGEPAEVYNCRCALIFQVKGYERETVKMSPKMGDMSYEEWKAHHKTNQRGSSPKEGNPFSDKPIARINNSAVLKRYGDIKQDVYLPGGVIKHIQERHPGDYERHVKSIASGIENPMRVFESRKSDDRAIFIGAGENGMFKAVVEMASKSSDSRSAIVSLHTAGRRTVEKLEKNSVVVFDGK